MVNISKNEHQTIESYVINDKMFGYINDSLNYYNLDVNYQSTVDTVLDDYLRIRKTQDDYHSKVNALRMFTIRMKTWDKDNYTNYEEM